MAISNQMLVGTGCLIVIALVVASTNKDGEAREDIQMEDPGQIGPGEDSPLLTDTPDTDSPAKDIRAIKSSADAAPTKLAVQDEINSAADLAARWDIIKTGYPSLHDLQELRTEAEMINARAQHIFLQRRPFFNDDASKRVYDQHIARVLKEVENKRQWLVESMPVDEVLKVPQNVGEPKQTLLLKGQADFKQDTGANEWPDIPEDFEQDADMTKMITQFARQEDGVTTVSPKDSGFQQAPDPLNADEEEPEGSNKRAAEDDAEGFNESAAPAKVVESEPEKVADLTEDPTTDFESAVDPPPSQPQGSPPPAVVAEKPTHEEKLAHQADAKGDPAFNSTNEQAFDDDLEGYEKIDNLKEARSNEEDPEAQFEKDKIIQDRTPSEAQKDASYKRLQIQLSSYVEAIHRIESQVTSHKEGGSGALTLMKQYIKYITMSKTISSEERKLRKETLEYAEGALARVLSIVGKVGVKRARDDSGLPVEGGSGGKKPRNIRRI